MTHRRMYLPVRLLLILAFAACPAISGAQETYPARPVRIVVPYPPGNATDTSARVLAEQLTRAFGRTFFVENRAGAAGAIGMSLAAHALPDGYTLVMGTSATQAMNPHIYKAVADAALEFEPILVTVKVPLVVTAAPGFPGQDLQDLLAASRRMPQGLSMAYAGTANHVMVEVLRARSGAPIVGVSYKGSPEAINDVIGGRVPALVDAVTASRPMVAGRKLKALAITTLRRSDLMPGVKTVAEQGFAGFELTAWNVLLAPKGTPAPVVRLLNERLGQILGRPEVRRQLLDAGLEAGRGGTSPEQTAEFLRAELAKWGELIKAAKVPMQ
jgi:tripartite-type tricarboxylate transporter receptor subunit TctC